MSDVNVAAASTLTPSILVGGFTLAGAILGALLANHLEHRREDRREHVEVIALLRAIRTELVEAWSRYQKAVGEQLEAHDINQGPFLGYFVADREYLSVYRCSADQIGRIPRRDLQHAIERAYIYLNALLDTHRMHVSALDRVESKLWAGDSKPEDMGKAAIDATKALQNLRQTTEEIVNEAVDQIDKHLHAV